MEHGIFSKAVGQSLDLVFNTMQKAAPPVMAAHQTVMSKVLMPAGTHAFAGAMTLLAKVVNPRRSTQQ